MTQIRTASIFSIYTTVLSVRSNPHAIWYPLTQPVLWHILQASQHYIFKCANNELPSLYAVLQTACINTQTGVTISVTCETHHVLLSSLQLHLWKLQFGTKPWSRSLHKDAFVGWIQCRCPLLKEASKRRVIQLATQHVRQHFYFDTMGLHNSNFIGKELMDTLTRETTSLIV